MKSGKPEKDRVRSLDGFGPGTMILTDQGEVPVEWLDTSYSVLTRDNGYQPLHRVWRTRVGAGRGQMERGNAPVRIPVGALGDGRPLHDLHVTANQHLLLALHGAARSGGVTEALAPAQAWADLGRAENYGPHRGWTVTHILCAQQEVILAQGAWVQSCPTGGQRAGSGMRAVAIRDTTAPTSKRSPMNARITVDRQEALHLIERSRESGLARWSVGVAKRA